MTNNPTTSVPPSQEEINAFCESAKSGDVAGVTAYLDQFGASIINGHDNIKDTALTWAAWAGHVQVLELLLERGADIDEKGMTGKTALGWAVQASRVEAVRFLLERGANPDIRDDQGSAPADQAQGNNNFEIMDLLSGRIQQEKKAAAEKIAAEKKQEEGDRALTAARIEKLKSLKPPKLKF